MQISGAGLRMLIVSLLVVGATGCSGLVSTPTLAPTPTPTPLSGRLTFAGSTSLQPLVDKVAQAFSEQHPSVVLEVAAGGSVVGIQAVHDGTVDIGMASRALSAAEVEGIEAHQVAVDVIAVVVPESNPVENLSLDQLRRIYDGEIRSWSEVGGLDLPCVPVAREETSGTRGAFDAIVLGGEVPAAASLRSAVTAGDMAALVVEEPSAIGYVGFGNLESGLRLLAIDGHVPSAEAVRDDSYPLVRPLLLLTGPLSQPLAGTFIDFALSEEGQRLVIENGWVSVS